MSRALFICQNCGKKIVECRACQNYARWDINEKIDKKGKQHSKKHHDQFCLEHRHEIPNFNTMKSKLRDPSSYRKIYKYNSKNLAKASSVAITAGLGAMVTGPFFYIAAPAIGGAIGSVASLSGAAATNYGLALLGFGSLAAGGFGMAGGMVVATAAGSALGGAVGAYVGTNYMGDIYKFDLKKIRRGKEPAIITVNGFLSEKDLENQKGYQDWKEIIKAQFPKNGWYHVHWEAKRLYDLGLLVARSGAGAGLTVAITKAAKHAAPKALKKVGPAGSVLTAIQLSTNPWHVALKKSEKTGVLLADILKRTNKRYILMGHSLGCRVIYASLRALSTTGEKIVDEVHLTGGAVDNKKENWKIAKKAVSGKIFNYYSKNDYVLRYLYRAGTFFKSKPIGFEKIGLVRGIRNCNVSRYVQGHMDYKPNGPRFIKSQLL
jgi:hypothetical protein